jgi:hypothetical protein
MATQLVASTVVCSKYCLNNVGCGLCIVLITADGEGAVHHVAHKITSLKINNLYFTIHSL